nr:DnaT-like ssDNA-binding protein [Pseudoxanthomonas sp.]
MALDTTIGGAASDSYASLAEAATYHASRGNTTWDATDSEIQEQKLRAATAHLDSRYEWRGYRVAGTQALDWPRSGVVVDGYTLDSASLPVALKRACMELAFKALTVDLFADSDAQYVESVTVGPISRKLSAPRNGGQRRFAVVDSLLRDLVRGGGASVELIRA